MNSNYYLTLLLFVSIVWIFYRAFQLEKRRNTNINDPWALVQQLKSMTRHFSNTRCENKNIDEARYHLAEASKQIKMLDDLLVQKKTSHTNTHPSGALNGH